jgi:hypothetical protein
VSTPSINVSVQFRLYPAARWILLTATAVAKCGIPVPRRLIKWIVCRSWLMRIGNGPWERVTIDSKGQVVG